MENSSLVEGPNGSAWILYNHYDKNLDDSDKPEDTSVSEEEARRRAINPWLGGKPHTIQEGLDEATSGSAWMFYNQYNPELLDAIKQVLVGERIEDVISKLIQEKETAGK